MAVLGLECSLKEAQPYWASRLSGVWGQSSRERQKEDKKEEPRGGPWASKALSYHVASQDHTMGMEADDPPTTLSIPRAGKIP